MSFKLGTLMAPDFEQVTLMAIWLITRVVDSCRSNTCEEDAGVWREVSGGSHRK